VRLENPVFWLILLAIALIIFGPKRLPELGQGLGRAIREFRKATSDVSDTVKDAVKEDNAPKATGTTYPPAGASPGEQPTVPPSEAPKG